MVLRSLKYQLKFNLRHFRTYTIFIIYFKKFKQPITVRILKSTLNLEINHFFEVLHKYPFSKFDPAMFSLVAYFM